MKKCLALILALAMVLCLAACTVDGGSSPSTASTASDPSQQSSAEPAGNVKYKIGMVANNIGIDDNQTECDRALREYAKSFTDVELTVLDAGGDSNTQISMIEDFIQQKVDLIIVWACDSLAVVTGLREAKEAGVPIMCTNNPIDESGYDTVHMVLAQGNMVLAVSEGTFGGAPTSYYDLWRVENGKIAEHWDVMETISDKSTWQNQNGKF